VTPCLGGQPRPPAPLRRGDVVYDLLFHTAARTLQDIAANPRHLGARLGFFVILHTWGQTLIHHPHVHCVIPAGGLADDECTWKPCRPGFFLPVRVLSHLFRGRFVAGLRAAVRDGHLKPHGRLVRYRQPQAFEQLLRESCRTEWVVYAKPPFQAPEHVLKYLARYTHRIAISNHRLLHVDDATVTFRLKDGPSLISSPNVYGCREGFLRCIQVLERPPPARPPARRAARSMASSPGVNETMRTVTAIDSVQCTPGSVTTAPSSCTLSGVAPFASTFPTPPRSRRTLNLHSPTHRVAAQLN